MCQHATPCCTVCKNVIGYTHDSWATHITVTLLPADAFSSCQPHVLTLYQCYCRQACKWQISLIVFSYLEAIKKWACWPSQYIITNPILVLFINIKIVFFFLSWVNVEWEWSNSGIRLHRYLCMYKWTTTVNKNMLWFLSSENAGNLCRGRLFFCQLYLLDFHTPAPAVPTAPSRTGQQEIGIQCFLDDFLKEMNLSWKMRTMNNETLDGMCLTHAIHTTCAVAESHVWNWRLWSQGWKEPRVGPLEWGGKQIGFLGACIIIWFGLDADQSASVRINLAFCNCEIDYIFFLHS